MARKFGAGGGYLDSALRGGNGPSEDVQNKKVARGQTIRTAHGMDNVNLAMDVPSSLRSDGGFKGGCRDLGHSIAGASVAKGPGEA